MADSTGGVRRNDNALVPWAVLVIVAAGVLLRSLRLDWQPLWWDEGYSMYFASEPLARMAWLTANDIHPPLYYALLNLWMGVLNGGPAPEPGRLLSVLAGALALPLQYFLARAMFAGRQRPALLGLLLLAFSPIHLYYSQEVRMYGLALALGLAASLALWQWVAAATRAQALSPGPHVDGQVMQAGASPLQRRRWAMLAPALGYLLAGLAALYTLYYAALLLAAHAAWAIVRLRKNVRALLGLLGVYLLMFLLYLPWLLYAVPQLVGYVGGKVQSDQDSPLGPLAYVERHLVAFTAGHVQMQSLPAEWLALAPATLAICAIILGLVLRQTLRARAVPQSKADASMKPGRGGVRHDSKVRPAEPNDRRDRRHSPASATRADSGQGAVTALWAWLIMPVLLGWLINLRLPFFPAGGERLLLIALPYFLLLLAYGLDRTWNVAHLGKLAAAALAANAVLGIVAYYTTPRYTADDYRALIRQVHQQGANEDTLLAIFPWQVGYWRAYDPYERTAAARGPQPLLLSEEAAEWSPEVAAAVSAALQRGTVWFPEPLTFGSSLPHEIEQYLAQQAVNVENRWYDATRLTAWARLPSPAAEPVGASFGRVQLQAAGVAPAAVESANQPVAAALVWANEAAENEAAEKKPAENGPEDEINISLRLQDAEGHVWASREYARGLPATGETISETMGLVAPAGLPPGGYLVAASVQTAAGEPLTIVGSDAAAVIGELEITAPEQAMSPVQLSIQHPLDRPARSDGLELLGYSGPDQNSQLLAGAQLAATLFFANASSQPPERQIYASLLDPAGAGVAGYEGWPLPAYPTNAWPQYALVQTPVAFYLPGSLPSGNYRLVAGFLDPATGEKTPPVELTQIAVVQRTASFTRPAPEQPLAEPPQLGTHARLLGYDLASAGENQTTITLYWEVLQPLLPPHHIFVHLDGADGRTRAQQDGPPVTGSAAAPTGSWQPGEFLTTQHILPAAPGPGDVLRVGLYDPATQVRLPVTINGQPAGDSVVIGSRHP